MNFNYIDENDSQDFRPLALEIFFSRPDVISIIDHRPHPLKLFTQLLPLYQGQKKPKIFIHVFGDFTLYYWHWEKCQALLNGFEVKFIVASPRQKILIDKFIRSPNALVCPFPVDHKSFYFSQTLRNHQRKAWGLSNRDHVFLFTGRLSNQKRIKTLIATFASTFANNQDAHLFIYGTADSIGDPFMGIHEVDNEYLRKIIHTYSQLSEKLQKRIHFMGALPNKELVRVYSAADTLVNLSVHNDEDFGMSVAEAQFCGLESIITNWGGLAGFAHKQIPEATHLIQVRLGKKNKFLSRPEIQAAMENSYQKKFLRRKDLSKIAFKKFGTQTCTAILRKSLKTPDPIFKRFSPFFKKVYDATMNQPYPPLYRTRENLISNLYKEIYSSYVPTNNKTV